MSNQGRLARLAGQDVQLAAGAAAGAAVDGMQLPPLVHCSTLDDFGYGGAVAGVGAADAGQSLLRSNRAEFDPDDWAGDGNWQPMPPPLLLLQRRPRR